MPIIDLEIGPDEVVRPDIVRAAWIADDAVIIGDVVLEEDANVWFKCVLRADIGKIRVGKRSNIQDLACIHMTDGLSHTDIGDDVTVGHGAIIHGATVGNGALIGMGSILLDNVVVGEESVIAAGSVVPPRMVIPPRSLVRGSPAKVIREATEDERAMGRFGAMAYVENGKRYRRMFDKAKAGR